MNLCKKKNTTADAEQPARDGVNLEIRDLKTEDSGEYTCEVEFDDREPLKQDNVLQVLGEW